MFVTQPSLRVGRSALVLAGMLVACRSASHRTTTSDASTERSDQAASDAGHGPTPMRDASAAERAAIASLAASRDFARALDTRPAPRPPSPLESIVARHGSNARVIDVRFLVNRVGRGRTTQLRARLVVEAFGIDSVVGGSQVAPASCDSDIDPQGHALHFHCMYEDDGTGSAGSVEIDGNSLVFRGQSLDYQHPRVVEPIPEIGRIMLAPGVHVRFHAGRGNWRGNS